MKDTFISKVLADEASLDDVDNFVGRWHEGDSGVELHEFLGMTWNEYKLWVERPETLEAIVNGYRRTRTPRSDPQPRLVTPLPVYDRRISFSKSARRTEKIVRVSPGGSRADWVIDGVEGTFRSIKDAQHAARRAS